MTSNRLLSSYTLWLILFFFSSEINSQLALSSFPTSCSNNQRNGVLYSAFLQTLATPHKPHWRIQTSKNTKTHFLSSPPPSYTLPPLYYQNTSSSGFVYAVHSDEDKSVLIILDAKDGRQLYSTLLSGLVDPTGTSGAVLVDGSVVVTFRGGVQRVNPDGTVKWTYLVKGQLSPPIVTTKVVVVKQEVCNRIFSLNIESGTAKWSKPISPSNPRGFCSDLYLSQDESLLWLVSSSVLSFSGWHSVDIVTGGILDMGYFPRNVAIELGFRSGNAVSESREGALAMIYNQGDVSCWPLCQPKPKIMRVESNSGVHMRTVEVPVGFLVSVDEAAISMFGEVLFITNREGKTLALNTTGDTVWVAQCPCDKEVCSHMPNFFDLPYQALFPPIIVVDVDNHSQGVIVTGVGNQICAFNMTTGGLLWNSTLDTYLFGQPAVTPNGDIFVSTLTDQNGSWLIALHPEDATK